MGKGERGRGEREEGGGREVGEGKGGREGEGREGEGREGRVERGRRLTFTLLKERVAEELLNLLAAEFLRVGSSGMIIRSVCFHQFAAA